MAIPFRLLIPLVPRIVPLATKWVCEQEARILAGGQALNESQINDARHAGVRYPEKIRLQYVDAIPMPVHSLLQRLGRSTGLVSPSTAGITLNYGIYIRAPYGNDRRLRVHEFVHVAQYERFGSVSAFLDPYLRECLDPGYPLGPMEQEAILTADRIVNGA